LTKDVLAKTKDGIVSLEKSGVIRKRIGFGLIVGVIVLGIWLKLRDKQ
jgi:hypothetical protein